MKKPFAMLTKQDVETIRRKPTSGKSVVYAFSEVDVEAARMHLEKIYGGTVRESFAARILLLNELY